ncbi:hypothetical protein V6N13_088830 [Hibiscus sabdariffa]
MVRTSTSGLIVVFLIRDLLSIMLVFTRAALDVRLVRGRAVGVGAARIDGWYPLLADWFKVNMDGARDISNGRASCGGVLRDNEELWGMYLRLEYAWELGARKVIFEVDSADAVFTVQHRRKGLVRVPILTQVLALLDKAREV